MKFRCETLANRFYGGSGEGSGVIGDGWSNY